MPTSSASKTDPNSNSDTSSNMASGLPSDAIDKVAHDLFQRGDRGQVHEQGDEAANVPVLDREVDVEEQDQTAAAAPTCTSNSVSPSPRTIEGSDMRMVRRSTFAIVARQALRMMFPVSASASCSRSMTSSSECSLSHDRPDEFQALGLRKDQERPPGERPFERLLHGDQLRRVASFHQLGGGCAGHDADGRNRQEHLLADHLAQAGRGAADTHIGDFRKRILFDFGELACVDLHCAAFWRRRIAPDRKAPSASSVRGLVTKAALSSRARAIISS